MGDHSISAGNGKKLLISCLLFALDNSLFCFQYSPLGDKFGGDIDFTDESDLVEERKAVKCQKICRA